MFFTSFNFVFKTIKILFYYRSFKIERQKFSSGDSGLQTFVLGPLARNLLQVHQAEGQPQNRSLLPPPLLQVLPLFRQTICIKLHRSLLRADREGRRVSEARCRPGGRDLLPSRAEPDFRDASLPRGRILGQSRSAAEVGVREEASFDRAPSPALQKSSRRSHGEGKLCELQGGSGKRNPRSELPSALLRR